MFLLFLESVGTTELLLILVVALIIFGPRKLPELSRSLGKGLSEFRRASDEFKRTWEREVSLETYERDRRATDAMLPPEDIGAQVPAASMIASSAAAESPALAGVVARGADADATTSSAATNDAPTGPVATADGASGAHGVARGEAADASPQSPHKADWL